MLLLGGFVLFLVLLAAVDLRKLRVRRKRKAPGPVRDALIPEEREAHWDKLHRERWEEIDKERRKRSDEMKAMRKGTP